MLYLLETFPAFDNLKAEISNLKSLAEGVSRQLRAWAESLQNSPITGQRYLTEKSQRATKAGTERDAFLKKLQKIREGKEQPERLTLTGLSRKFINRPFTKSRNSSMTFCQIL